MHKAAKMQRHSIRLYLAVAGIALISSDQAVFGQSSTNCIAMGYNMVHCDTMNMEAGNSGDGGAALGAGIGALIARNREMSFRKKIGKMLSMGDCQTAVAYAYEKGRLDIAKSISENCTSK